ncbi:sulfatase-like hydrolase/transferase [candidate division KSB1 bacterium]|nr:sulfatase-like hydrolase/transferase [candidate division KSB1 bacterium]
MQDMNRRRFLKIAGAGSVMLTMTGFKNGTAATKRPNVLIYLADDQYKSSVGCYGADPSHTPNIDMLAEQGVRFTNCFTPSSICTPNRGVLLSGMYPIQNGAHANHSGFKDGVKSLPNYMKELGYRACIVGKDGIQKPSDLYEWEFRIDKSEETVPAAPPPKYEWNDSSRHKKTRFGEVEEFISSDDSRPFCIFHAASLPHDPELEELPNGLAGYNASNWYMDFEFGKYLQLLEKYGLTENTIVIYNNDNEAQKPRTKNTLYDTGLNIPFVMRWPGLVKPGTVNHELVTTLDILPTLFKAAGATPPENLEGKSLLGLLNGTSPLHDELYFSYTAVNVGNADWKRDKTPYPIRAVRNKQYKYIRNLNHEIPHPKYGWTKPYEELYDIQKDPQEKNNLADLDQFQSVKKELSSKMDAWMQRIGDEGIQEELKALEKYPPRWMDKEKYLQKKKG